MYDVSMSHRMRVNVSECDIFFWIEKCDRSCFESKSHVRVQFTKGKPMMSLL